jgi:phage shock protein PspC (stress-responsive transcriptional regulator)
MNETTATAQPPSDPAPPPAPAPTPAARLRRSRSDRKVAGVCGGLARHLGIDPLILRILVVVLTIFGGSGLLLYAAGWLLIPDDGMEASELQLQVQRHGTAALVVVGAVVTIALLGIGGAWDSGWNGQSGIWPLIVIGGIALVVYYSRHPQAPPGQAFPAPAATPGTPGTPGTPATAGPVEQPTEPYATQPSTTQPYTTAPVATPYVPVPPATSYAEPVRPREPRQRSVLGLLTVSVGAIAAGVMVLLDRSGAVHIHPVPFVAVLLGIVGLGLLVGAFVGRARGLIALGVLLSLTLAIAAAVPGVSSRSTGPVTWRPTTLAAIPAAGFEWGAGDARLDLTALPTSGTVHVSADLGAGTLTVTVPANDTLQLTTHVGVGSTSLPDGTGGAGFGTERDLTFAPDGPSAGTLVLDLTVGAGTLEVRRAQA